MNRAWFVGVVIFFAVVVSRADISWSVVAQPILGPDNEGDQAETSFNTPLPGNAFDASAGYLIQLIYAGANGVVDAIPGGPISLSGTAVQGDDTVVATRWVGAGRISDTAGKFNSGSPFADDVAGNYFVRAWVGISEDSALVTSADPAARIPVAINGTHWWYGDSAVWNNPGDPGGVPQINSHDFSLTSQIVADNLVMAPAAGPDIEIVTINLLPGSAMIRWSSSPGVNYDLAIATAITNNPTWSVVQSMIPSAGTNTEASVVLDTDIMKFFRVYETP